MPSKAVPASCSKGLFSNTFIENLRIEILTLTGRHDENLRQIDIDLFEQIVEQEIKRLVKRSWIKEGYKAYKRDHPEQTADQLIVEMQEAVIKLFHIEGENNLQNFLHWLEISDFINRQPDRHAH